MANRKNSQYRRPGNKKQEGRPPEDYSRIIFLVFIVLGVFMLLNVFMGTPEPSRMSYSEFVAALESNAETGTIVKCELTDNVVRGRLSNGQSFTIIIPQNDMHVVPLMSRNVPQFFVNSPNDFFKNMLYSLLPMLLFFALLYFFVYRGGQGGGGRILSFGKSRARQMDNDENKITFKDVAGVEEAKEELTEIIEFLKDPQKFEKLGGKIPKGVLLMGPPGTGKTLLAKAVAGEAGVPFFSISGSDFVEMFVGVGASRVRDLFEQGKKSAKTSGKGAIIFIDEIDAVGRQRFSGIGGGHDEREQTLNALLVEMDGFDTAKGVILIGATNRPDVLDPALLRPGRFDRQIVVDRPDIRGRQQILEVHCEKVTTDDSSVDLARIARHTAGFSGADLANLVNEAALLAARRSKKAVEHTELAESIEKVWMGPERKSRVISRKEKEVTAIHESGHALVTLLCEHADPLQKVSIIPRGRAMGYSFAAPLEDRHNMSRRQLLDKISIALGGRAAEELVFEELTTGATSDLKAATDIAHEMVCSYGMSDRVGTLVYSKGQHEVFLGRDLSTERPYSEQTAVLIDEEVKRIISECYAFALDTLRENRERLDTLSTSLLEREVLDGDEVCDLLGLEEKKMGVEYINKVTPDAEETEEHPTSEDADESSTEEE